MKKINKRELHEIFEKLRIKDQNAYNKFYENYYNLVYGIVFSFLKNKEDSEDVTHEIFTKIYKLDTKKLPTNNESSWLFTVSKNECFLFLRKVKPNISIDEIYEIPTTSNDIDSIIDVEYYNKLISILKEDEKLIVSLKVLSNFTFKKISQVMNIPIGTVQWKYYNAINSLKVSVSSLVGAVIAFVIVLARGEVLKQKEYLNENFSNESQDITNSENNEMEDENIYEGNKNVNINNDNATENNKIEENDKITADNSTNEINSVTENHNSTETNNSAGSDIIQNTIKDMLQNAEMTESSVHNSNEMQLFGSTSFDIIHSLFIAISVIFLITFLISFKFYQQKLRKKLSK